MRHLLTVSLVALVLAGGCGRSVSKRRQIAIEQFQVGHLADAKAGFEQVLDRRPFDAESLYYMGRIYQGEGKYLRAIHYYETCLNFKPGHDAAARWLAKAKAEAPLPAAILEGD